MVILLCTACMFPILLQRESVSPRGVNGPSANNER